MMTTKVNQQTGLEEVEFTATLLSMSDEVRTYQNAAGETKEYKLAEVEFTDNDGTVQKATAIVHKGNYINGMEVGKSYLATASLDTRAEAEEGSVVIRVSHLTRSEYAGRAKATMFGTVFTNRLVEVAL